MAGDYYPALRRAIKNASAETLEQRKAIYHAAGRALPAMLKSFTKQQISEEQLALGLAVVRVETDIESERRPRRSMIHARLIKVGYSLSRLAALVLFFLWIGYPAAAPREYVPQWLLNHAWVLLIWCCLFASCFMFIMYGMRLYLNEIFKDARGDSKNLKELAFQYPLWIPLLLAVMLIPVSGVIYNLGNLSRYYNPFGQEFSFLDGYCFLLDQAMKGMFNEIVELFGLHIPHKLKFNPLDHFIFWAVVVAYKMFMSFVGLGAVFLIVRWAVVRLFRILRVLMRPVSRVWKAYYQWSIRQQERQAALLKRWSPAAVRPIFEWNERLIQRRVSSLESRKAFLKRAFLDPGKLVREIEAGMPKDEMSATLPRG